MTENVPDGNLRRKIFFLSCAGKRAKGHRWVVLPRRKEIKGRTFVEEIGRDIPRHATNSCCCLDQAEVGTLDVAGALRALTSLQKFSAAFPRNKKTALFCVLLLFSLELLSADCVKFMGITPRKLRS